MKRILTLFLIVAVFPSCQQSSTGNGKPLYTAPLGVQAYTFRNSFPKDVAKTLDTIKLMGFTEIEGIRGRMSPEEFKQLCDERGISIPSISPGFVQLEKGPDSIANIAKRLGAEYVMCGSIPHKDGVFTLDDAKKAVDVFNKVGKVLKDRGLTFCYHAHGYEFQPYGNGTLLDYLFENTNPDYVSFEMDIFWIQFGGGDPVALLKKYGNRWKLMHLKDLRKGAEKNLTGHTRPENDVILGTGDIDIPGILRESKKAGIQHFFIEDESDKEMIHVPKSITYLKSLKE